MSHNDEHHGVGHIVPHKVLILTGSALLVLTVITVLAAKVNFEDFDMFEMNIVVALGIALLKASLVCLFFMHLRWDRPFNAFILIGSLGFVVLFIGFAMTDTFEYGPDVRQYEQTNLKNAEVPKIQDKLAELTTVQAEHAAGNHSQDTHADDADH